MESASITEDSLKHISETVFESNYDESFRAYDSSTQVEEEEEESDKTCYCCICCEKPPPVTFFSRYKVHLDPATATADYIKDRKIKQLLHYLMTILLAKMPEKPIPFLIHLIDECMLFRAGIGIPPVLFEEKHLKALLKSYDPCDRGWLSCAQVQRAFNTIGLEFNDHGKEAKIPTEDVLATLRKTQNDYLFALVTAEYLDETPK